MSRTAKKPAPSIFQPNTARRRRRAATEMGLITYSEHWTIESEYKPDSLLVDSTTREQDKSAVGHVFDVTLFNRYHDGWFSLYLDDRNGDLREIAAGMLEKYGQDFLRMANVFRRHVAKERKGGAR